MVAAHIDISAVQAELQAISALMGEISRLIGPQTWQGGSAAAFTTDLQGHNRSLDRMAHDVLQTVARLDPRPIVIAPPSMPRVGPVPGMPGVASVSPTGLERLETALLRAADALPKHAGKIRSLLRIAGPVGSGTSPCDRTAAWCREQASRTRTRIRYALAENGGEKKADPLGALSRVPDVERFGAKEMAELGTLQARAFSKHLADPNPLTPETLTEIGRTLRENAKDANYTAAFFGNVPPGSVGKLAHRLYRWGDDVNRTDRDILANVGTALAALSRRKEGQQAVSRALGPIGADMPGQALLVKLSAPEVKWSSALLLAMAKESLRWRQKYPSYKITLSSRVISGESYTATVNQPHRPWWQDWGLSTLVGGPDTEAMREYDPALNVLGRIALQKDTAAARELAATKLESAFTVKDAEKAGALTWLNRGMGDTYAALLVAPDWPDGGKAAGNVIALATTPEKGHEEEAAENAAAIMKSVAWWNGTARDKLSGYLRKDGAPDWFPGQSTGRAPGWVSHSGQYAADLGPGLRNGLLQMARMHLPAIAEANRTSGGTGLPETDPATRQVYVDIGGEDMKQFLRTLAADDKTWAQLAYDTQMYRQRLFAWALRSGSLNDAVVRAGYVEGNLIAAYGKERITREELTKAQVEEAQKRLGILRDVGSVFLAVSPPGQVNGVNESYGAATNMALDKIKYADFEKKVEQIKAKNANYSDQIYIDLARGYLLAEIGGTDNSTFQSFIQNRILTEEQRSAIIQGARGKDFYSPKEKMTYSGRRIIADVQDKINHNAPPKE
ncbi:hypothetical protein ACQEU3_19115 [Spirillospora sp. CA-253888]